MAGVGGIISPQTHRDPDDGEAGDDDRPGLGAEPFEPLRIEIDRAERRRRRDDPAPVAARRPDADADREGGPAEDEDPVRLWGADFSQASRAVQESMPVAQLSPG